MKHLIALTCLFFAVSAFADDAPKVSAMQAVQAGEKSINDRNLGKEIYISSVSLAHATILGGETYWLVRWSHPIPTESNNYKEREIGLKVGLDGTIARVVKNMSK